LAGLAGLEHGVANGLCKCKLDYRLTQEVCV